ncbi:ubiquitin-like modifier 1 [Cladophialophora yegresii CBS 114405]|uniref:Ubiquitin-related modifier 1 n=1 Tax=Cladophialophora yegresii CBS 114405 TaxID=1182544 RepID=W9WDS0_9EURO|nr:ubiquitin-like modifier 1 [Cladophialophora yegresii CBS 114405]EXJ62706.1 ubiquitin-like modifier 1 [Cladophialophora yegresii CBS 114405]
MPETVDITVEFTGGLELLFDNVAQHSLSFAKNTDEGKPPTVGFLVKYLCEHLMKDSRKELFVLNGNVRPGILVLINDSDWELEGEDKYELADKDKILFVSTLHGG